MKSDKSIAFFTEMNLEGKTPRMHQNMRTEFAWFTALNANHHSIHRLEVIEEKYDLGILIIPKNVTPFIHMDIPFLMRKVCKKIAFMQEGPSWYFQSLPLSESIWFFNTMTDMDFALAHNDVDLKYYEGLLGKQTFINPTLMIEDIIKDLPTEDRKGVIIGGNLVRWYGGFNSLIVASEFEDEIWAPRMGRMEKEEEAISGLNHLPYTNWYEWIRALNNFKYAVHLNPNSIGGTFSLNCAYLGIPCIGNEYSNTQRICFPELSTHPEDLKKAKELAIKLKTDKDFYNDVALKSKQLYYEYFSEKTFLETWEKILQQI